MNKFENIISVVGAVILFAGLFLQFIRFEYAPYIYILGSVMFSWMQAKSIANSTSKNIVIRRLKRQQLIGAMLLVFTGVMMLLWHHNEWILCLSISALLELYTAFRIPNEEEKEMNK